MFHGGVAVQQFKGLVLITIINDGTVVAGKDQNGIVGDVEAIQRVHNFTDGPVQLEDNVTTGAESAFSCKTRVGDTWHVYILRTHIQEERFFFMGSDELLRFMGDDVGYILVFPESGLAACHPTDAGDTVDNGIVMPLAGF